MKYRASGFDGPSGPMSQGLAVYVSPLNRGRPVDLVHLAKLSKGDVELELQYLSMFDTQLQASVKELSALQEFDDAKRSLAGLKGAARNVGAFGVADFCAQAEEALREDFEEYREVIDDLNVASAEITAFIVNMAAA